MTRLVLFLMSCAIAASAQPADYYSPESVLQFADHLFRHEDYLRAAYEYDRYRFLQTGGDDIDWAILLRAGVAFQCAGEYDRSLDLFASILENVEDHHLQQRAIYGTGMTYFRLADYEESLLFLQAHSPVVLMSESRLLIGADLMMLGRWQIAGEALEGYGLPSAEPLLEIAREGADMRHRSPLAAALLSTAVPGSGKIYAGEYADGIQSLVLIGLLGTLSVLSFRADGVDSVRGWIYASVGGLLHAGNIYGSVISARRYNRLQEDALIAKVREQIPTCPEFLIAP